MTKRIDTARQDAKQRMREYLNEKKISYAQAEVTCGFKRGFLSAGGIVGSDKLNQFLQAFPDCDIYYIVSGNAGDLRLNTVNRLIGEIKTKSGELAKTLKALDKMVANMVTKK